MHRFYAPPENSRGDEIHLEGREAHHALHVLRIKPGDRVSVLDGTGHEHFGRLAAVSRHALTISVEERKFTPASDLKVTLFQAIPKGQAWENIVEKATELGAHRIVPVLTDRVVVRVDVSAKGKLDKWKWIAIDAIKQCGNPWLPQIDPPRKFAESVEDSSAFDLALIASLGSNASHPRTIFESYARQRGCRPRSVAVWIGPEGDFTPAETQAIIQHRAHPVTLGPRVLRADTAAIYSLSVIDYELGG